MNHSQLISVIKQFSLALRHELPPDFGEGLPSYTDLRTPEDFARTLSENGTPLHLVFTTNTADSYQALVDRLSFPVLVFFADEKTLAPAIIQPGKNLQPEAEQLLPDGTRQSVTLGALTERLHTTEEGKVLFVAAFPFRSVVGEGTEGPSLSPIKRLLNLLRGERRDISYLYVYAVAVGIINLSLPLGTQAIVGFISGGMWLNSIVILIGLVVIGVIVGGGLQIMQLSMVEVMQRRIFAKTALELAYRIPRLETEAVLRYYTPELVNRFFDVLTIQKGLPTLLISLLTAIIQINFCLILLSFYHPFFVFFGLLLVSLLVLMFYLTGKRGLDSSLTESKYKYKVAYWLEELGRALPTFKMAGTTQLPTQRVNHEVGNYLMHRKAHFGVLIRQYSYVIAFKTLVTAGLLIIGAILVIDRQITLGQFVASELIIVLVIGSVETIILNLDTVYDMLTAVDKIGQVTDLQLEPEGKATLAAEQGVRIQTRNLRYRYPGQPEYVLKNINLDIAPGERVCITGYNDSGKSTLVNILDGSYRSYEGVVAVNDIPLSNLNVAQWRNHIAKNVSTEDIFNGSVLDNVTLRKPTTSYQTAVEALRAVGAMEAIQRLPQGLDTTLVSSGSSVSTSLAHKIVLARCIAKQPKVLMLNDFFPFFTRAEQQQFVRYLTDDQHSWSLIVVSTDPLILSQCTKIVVLQEGETVAEGTYETLKDHAFFQQLTSPALVADTPC